MLNRYLHFKLYKVLCVYSSLKMAALEQNTECRRATLHLIFIRKNSPKMGLWRAYGYQETCLESSFWLDQIIYWEMVKIGQSSQELKWNF